MRSKFCLVRSRPASWSAHSQFHPLLDHCVWISLLLRSSIGRAPGGWKTLVRLPMRQLVAVSLWKTLNAVSHLNGNQSNLCGGPASLSKDMQTEQFLCCSGMTESDTEHSVPTKKTLYNMPILVTLSANSQLGFPIFTLFNTIYSYKCWSQPS